MLTDLVPFVVPCDLAVVVVLMDCPLAALDMLVLIIIPLIDMPVPVAVTEVETLLGIKLLAPAGIPMLVPAAAVLTSEMISEESEAGTEMSVKPVPTAEEAAANA